MRCLSLPLARRRHGFDAGRSLSPSPRWARRQRAASSREPRPSRGRSFCQWNHRRRGARSAAAARRGPRAPSVGAGRDHLLERYLLPRPDSLWRRRCVFTSRPRGRLRRPRGDLANWRASKLGAKSRSRACPFPTRRGKRSLSTKTVGCRADGRRRLRVLCCVGSGGAQFAARREPLARLARESANYCWRPRDGFSRRARKTRNFNRLSFQSLLTAAPPAIAGTGRFWQRKPKLAASTIRSCCVFFCGRSAFTAAVRTAIDRARRSIMRGESTCAVFNHYLWTFVHCLRGEDLAGVARADAGSQKMQEISDAIAEGAQAI